MRLFISCVLICVANTHWICRQKLFKFDFIVENLTFSIYGGSVLLGLVICAGIYCPLESIAHLSMPLSLLDFVVHFLYSVDETCHCRFLFTCLNF